MSGSNEPSHPRSEAQIILQNKKSELGRLASFVQQFCDDASVDKETQFALDLSLTEWVTNILNYGALLPEGKIEIHLRVNGSELRARVEDGGKSFNPLDRPEVDIGLPLDVKPIGGLGIHMVRKLMDETVYERCNDKNVLSLTKRFQSFGSPVRGGENASNSSMESL